MKVTKNNVSFLVSGKFSENWFSKNSLDIWEPYTFYILDYYKDKINGIYIDIGSWIGPTVLYATNIYKKVIAIEPDPIAVERLKENIKVNNFKNISLIEKALDSIDGYSLFGGNGEFGNSMSSLVIAGENYKLQAGFQSKLQHNYKMKVPSFTIESLINQENINIEEVSLIKMDIEGGEIILIPYLENFLNTYKPVLYISLHYVFLELSDIKKIIDILFNIYDKCYCFGIDGDRDLVDKNEVNKYSLETLVFER